MEQKWLVSIYTVTIKHALRTADFGLGLKHRLGYKTGTKHYGLPIKLARTLV